MFKKTLVVLPLVAALTACGAVETGEVAVYKSPSGEISTTEKMQGLYQAVWGDYTKYTVKQIPVSLDSLKPKASDNLRLQDLDVTVYYSINAIQVAETTIKYNSVNKHDDENGRWLPAYFLVEAIAKSTTNEMVAKFPSMQINDKRAEIENLIRDALQKELDRTDKGVFAIDRVNITNALTDQTVEKSIQDIAISENRRKQAENDLAVARVKAEENKIRSSALDSKILAEKQLEVLANANVIVVPVDFKGIVTVPQQAAK